MDQDKKEQFIDACYNDNVALIKRILEEWEVDVNGVDLNARTGLIYAAANGYDQIVQLILSHPQVDINIKDCGKMSAYDYAEKFGMKEIMLLLKMKKLKQKIYSNDKII